MAGYNYSISDEEEKAGYNQAARITEILAALRTTFIGSMMEDNLRPSLEACRGILNVISGKVREEIIKGFNTTVYEIQLEIPKADLTYVSEGGRYFKFYEERIATKKKLENLWRAIEQVQDEYGYGMVGEEDSGL